MTERRNKMISRLMLSAPNETEQTMMKLVVERICIDMCEFFSKFYALQGPGAVIYIPDAEDPKDSMFYLTLEALMNALNDFNSRDMEGPADVMKKAIVRAETVDPSKESLFIIQDKDQMSLIHYKHENPDNSFLRM
jgi:hypothetical protein